MSGMSLGQKKRGVERKGRKREGKKKKEELEGGGDKNIN